MRSLWSGVSGLRNHQTKMDVIGNNIANVNTVGYKGSRVTFQDMLSQTMQGAGSPSGTLGGTNPLQIGMGMAVASVDTIFTDGTQQATGKQTDLAISGDGFFQLSNDNGQTKVYSRSGAFDFDTNGTYVVPNTGYKVMGYQIDPTTNKPIGAPGPIAISKTDLLPGKESTSLIYSGNLLSSALGTISATSAVVQAGTTVESTTSNETMLLPGGSTAAAIAADGATTPALTTALTNAATAATTAKADAILYQTAAVTAAASPTAANITAALTAANTASTSAQAAVTSAQALVTAGQAIPGLATATTAAIAAAKVAADTAASLAATAATSAANISVTADALVSARNANAAAAGAAATTVPVATAASVAAAVNADPGVSAADKAIANAAAIVGAPPATAASVAEAMAKNLATALAAANVSSDAPASLKVYASSGTAYEVNGTFEKVGANTWSFTPTNTITDSTGATIANVTTTPANKPVLITFSPSGAFISSTPYTMTIKPVVPPAAASGPATFTITPDFSTMTQFDSKTTAMASDTDGYGAGSLDKLNISSDGIFSATYTNGITKKLAQVALFRFDNPGGLEKSGGNFYTESNNSGVATKDYNSKVSSGNLEMSNVDLAQQFSDMIVTQRGFQANSKIITTTDTMLEEVVNLKR